jgi:hypothetical protein
MLASPVDTPASLRHCRHAHTILQPEIAGIFSFSLLLAGIAQGHGVGVAAMAQRGGRINW